jgi:hypothetical protein
MRARSALFHHLQSFFETHLRGVFKYDDILPHVPEEVENTPGRRRNAYGRVKEIVQADFGRFQIMLASPHEAPPLGRVELRFDGKNFVSGPIDSDTFSRAGEAVKQIQEGRNFV